MTIARPGNWTDILDTDSNGDGIADGWQAYTSGSPVPTGTRTVANGYQTYTSGFTALSKYFGIATPYATIPVAPSTNYHASAVLSGSQGANTRTQIWIAYYNSAGTYIFSGPSITLSSLTSTPTEYATYVGASPSSAAYAQLVVRSYSNAGTPDGTAPYSVTVHVHSAKFIYPGGTQVATQPWGWPITDEINRLTTESGKNTTDLDAVLADLDSMLNPKWKLITPNAGWVAQNPTSQQNPAYAISGNFVFLRGMIKNATGANVTANTNVAQLPAEAVPEKAIVLNSIATVTSASDVTWSVRVGVTAAGMLQLFANTVHPVEPNDWFTIDRLWYSLIG